MHTYVLIALLLILACTVSCAAVLPPDKPGMAVKVEAGQYTVRGKKVKVAATTEVTIEAVDMIGVKNEWHVLGDEQPQTWHAGTGLNKTYGPVDIATRLPKAIAPETVKVHTADETTTYVEGKDYFLDHDWGGLCRIPTGSIPEKTKVFFDYKVYLQRVDAVQVSKDGQVSIKKGAAAQVCPEIPTADKDCTVLANIYVPYRTSAITADNIYPLPGKKLKWEDLIKVSGREHLKKTLKTLKEGLYPISVVCWGDSVTSGGSSSTPDKCYVELFRAWLKDVYPKSNPALLNAGIGGSNTDSRREGFDREVLSYRPDLITVEFVNDSGMSADQIKKNWDEFIARARAKSPEVEFILITPHSVMPEWMGGFKVSIPAMRKAAEDNDVALADTANIWENLRALGIPYQILEANGINHPNDLGHQFFAACLQELLKRN